MYHMTTSSVCYAASTSITYCNSFTVKEQSHRIRNSELVESISAVTRLCHVIMKQGSQIHHFPHHLKAFNCQPGISHDVVTYPAAGASHILSLHHVLRGPLVQEDQYHPAPHPARPSNFFVHLELP